MFTDQEVSLTLTIEEIQLCAEYGDMITRENENVRDSRNYTAKQLTDRQGNILGVMAEYGFLKAIGRSENWEDIWIPFTKLEDYGPETTGKPDIAGRYEIRRAHYENSGIPVRRKDVNAGAIIVQGYVGYVNLPGGKIRATRDIKYLGWTNAVDDYNTTVPTRYQSYDTRTQYNKRPMSDLDLSYVINNV